MPPNNNQEKEKGPKFKGQFHTHKQQVLNTSKYWNFHGDLISKRSNYSQSRTIQKEARVQERSSRGYPVRELGYFRPSSGRMSSLLWPWRCVEASEIECHQVPIPNSYPNHNTYSYKQWGENSNTWMENDWTKAQAIWLMRKNVGKETKPMLR